MALQISVPPLGESVTEAIIAKWHKSGGDVVQTDEVLVDLETDKVTLEVNSPGTGILTDLRFKEGDTVKIGDILGMVEEANVQMATKEDLHGESAPAPTPTPSPAVAPQQTEQPLNETPAPSINNDAVASPAATKYAAEQNIDLSTVSGSAKDGEVITKADVMEAESAPTPAPALENNAPSEEVPAPTPALANAPSGVSSEGNGREKRVKMTKLRQTIAKRLKDSQNTAAILSTFNEVDMSNIFAIRKKYQENFKKKYDIKLGFMSFFIKATILALKENPDVNAEIDGDEIVYKNYFNIGVAVGTDQGLVVPVVRDVDQMSFAEIEQEIVNLGTRAREGKLSMSEMSGGCFTITNGGIYGSLLSTPIINPPQSGILGMHNIVERAVVVNGEIVVRPMMYIALSYDHRIVDGKGAVTFLVKIKELCENPERLLFDV